MTRGLKGRARRLVVALLDLFVGIPFSEIGTFFIAFSIAFTLFQHFYPPEWERWLLPLFFVRIHVAINNKKAVRHLGFESTFGLGIANVPVTEPLASVTTLPPEDPPSGVTYTDISILSKKG